MKTRALLLLTCAWIAPCMAQAEPSLPSDSRIKLVKYDEGDVYTVTTKYGYQTNIVFGVGESIETISVGDRSLWQIIPSANRLFIRPMQEGISTNMTILTNRHSYQFDLKSLGADEKDGENIYVARFVYDGDRMRGAAPQLMMPPPPPPPPSVAPPPPMAGNPMRAEPPSAPPTPSAPAQSMTQPIYPNYNYTYSGPDTLAPIQVFDNGKTTFLKYHTLPLPLPEIYIVDTAGNLSPAPAETQDSMIAVRTVANRLALKHNDDTITIYNEMLNPGKNR